MAVPLPEVSIFLPSSANQPRTRLAHAVDVEWAQQGASCEAEQVNDKPVQNEYARYGAFHPRRSSSRRNRFSGLGCCQGLRGSPGRSEGLLRGGVPAAVAGCPPLAR
jgi:hypothetical protein